MLIWKFISVNAYIKKDVKSTIFHLKTLEKEEQPKPKVSRIQKVIKSTAEINESKNRKNKNKN